MSCASSNLSNQDPNYYQTVNGYAVPSSIPYNRNTPTGLRKYKGGYPPFAPTIGSLSVTSSNAGTYSLVYIYGTNFLPPCYGNTYVNFGPFKQLPITFYSTNSISFVVPLNAQAGIYKVVVVNIYNSNFSPAVNQTYSGNPNFSNPVTYQIIGYIVNGSYTITSNAQYNTIISFTANSRITFYQNYTVDYIVVGGGGGGGGASRYIDNKVAGGGGGGQVLYSTTAFNTNIFNTTGFNTTYNIIVGQGGSGGIGTIIYPNAPDIHGQNGQNGNTSQIVVDSKPIATANGGQGGFGSNNASGNGGTSGFGTAGGVGVTGGNAPFGGGGGGANGSGGNGSLNIYTPIYGTTFGAGGGGGSWNYAGGNGGNTNAGNGGGANSSLPTSGKPNTGCGGGGGGSVAGGNGGSGIVIFYFNT